MVVKVVNLIRMQIYLERRRDKAKSAINRLIKVQDLFVS